MYAIRSYYASRRQRVARHDQLVAGEEQSEPDAPQDRQRGDADRGRETGVLRLKARARGEDSYNFV